MLPCFARWRRRRIRVADTLSGDQYRGRLRNLFCGRSTAFPPLFPATPTRPSLLSSSRFRAPQAMQRDFGKAINANCHNRRSNTRRGIARHLVISPRARAELAGQNRVECEGDRSRQTNLPAVGMATQQQIEARMCRLPVNFRRVRQKDRKC